MNDVKLFGNSRSAAHVAKGTKRTGNKEKKEKVKKPLKTLAIILAVILCLEGLYFFAVYTQNSFVSRWRTTYINTAMSTMRHQWLATALIPPDVIQAVMDENAKIVEEMDKQQTTSTWTRPEEDSSVVETPAVSDPTGSQEVEVEVTPITPDEPEVVEPPEPTYEELQAIAREEFYKVFWEIDPVTMDAYLEEHPEALDNGWEGINIDESEIGGEGTSIRSIFDEQVLAINVPDKVLLLRIKGKGYQGVLAVGKEPAQLSVEYSKHLGRVGQTVKEMAEQSEALLAMTASAFHDVDAMGNQGNGNGGILAGWMMSNGYIYGDHYTNVGNNRWKRLELHENNLLYVKDTSAEVSEDCTDAMEFQPAMIVDGEVLVTDYWTEMNPRACIGQTDKYEILMLAIEGRRPLEGILGTDVNTCADIMKMHGCMQAMNVDGGTSAMMWYNGKNVIRCSNAALEDGRGLPNIWAYKPIQQIGPTE